MGPRTIFELLKATYKDWKEDDASTLAAALAYYTIFSLGPLLLMAIVVAGLALGEAAAQGQVSGQLEGLLGPQGAGAVQTAVENSRKPAATAISAVIGLAGLLWSASSLFGQLQRALNTIWEVQEDPNAGMVGTIKKRLLSMTMVLGIGFLLLVSLVLSAAVSAAGRYLGDLLPGGETPWHLLEFALSFGVVTLLFAAIYKVLPDAKVAWRDVWVGAAVTALLFAIGKLLLGLYLGHASVGSTYGAAGSLLVVLVWVYYSAQILYFGAEFTQVYARRRGRRIIPEHGAVPLTEEARAQQGRPGDAATARAAHADGASGTALASATHAPGRNGRGGTADGTTDGTAAAHDGRSGPVKKVLWAGLASGTVAVAGLLARRGSVAIWQKVLHEPPPTR